jgi:hypothetical protein
MSVYIPKRVAEMPDTGFGVCLWRLPDGTYIQNDNGDYLCAQGVVGNLKSERQMVAAAASLGITEGKPFWLPAFRKISQSEWEDQMEALLDGRMPDPVDIYRQEINGVQS